MWLGFAGTVLAALIGLVGPLIGVNVRRLGPPMTSVAACREVGIVQMEGALGRARKVSPPTKSGAVAPAMSSIQGR